MKLEVGHHYIFEVIKGFDKGKRYKGQVHPNTLLKPDVPHGYYYVEYSSFDGRSHNGHDHYKIENGVSELGYKVAYADVTYQKFNENTNGYHKSKITKGQYGELSKIQEELDELNDAASQGIEIMELNELADLYGAIEGYLETHWNGWDMEELKKMSDATKRAFKSGERK